MFTRKMTTILMSGALALVLGTGPAMAASNWSGAFKYGIDWWTPSEPLEHTYFCLNPGQLSDPNNRTDCFSITINAPWGAYESGKTNGAYTANTGKWKSYHDRCLARSRASNNWLNACGAFSQFYGINGVCHQHTNRGQMSMHADWIDPNILGGGWLSYFLYGPYGISYPTCFVWSEAQCAFSW
jgi:hypothetical protein